MENNQPVWRMHRGQINASAWKRTVALPGGQNVERLSVQIERRYKKPDGTWASSQSFTLSELYQLHHFLGGVIDRVVQSNVQETGGEVA